MPFVVGEKAFTNWVATRTGKGVTALQAGGQAINGKCWITWDCMLFMVGVNIAFIDAAE
jgi:hypothetical protein